jgi:phosphopantetheinyl transferase (holo-ACP synthase)
MLGFKDVRVEVCEGGGVQIVSSGWRTSADGQLTERAEQVGRLSISHDGEYAIATVMATPLQITPAALQDNMS